MKRLILIIMAFAYFNVIGYAQKILLNKNYKPEKKELKIVVAPYFSEGAKEINDIFYLAFNKGKFTLADTSQIIHNIANDCVFYRTLEKTNYLGYDKNQLKSFPNIYSNLKAEEIENFKKNTLGADIIIVGSRIDQRKVTKVKGSGFFRISGDVVAFDLRTGEFIMQCADEVKLSYNNITSDSRPPVKELFDSLYQSFTINLK